MNTSVNEFMNESVKKEQNESNETKESLVHRQKMNRIRQSQKQPLVRELGIKNSGSTEMETNKNQQEVGSVNPLLVHTLHKRKDLEQQTDLDDMPLNLLKSTNTSST